MIAYIYIFILYIHAYITDSQLVCFHVLWSSAIIYPAFEGLEFRC